MNYSRPRFPDGAHFTPNISVENTLGDISPTVLILVIIFLVNNTHLPIYSGEISTLFGYFPPQVSLLVVLYLLAVAALIRKYLLIPDRREDSIRLTSDSGSIVDSGRGEENCLTIGYFKVSHSQ